MFHLSIPASSTKQPSSDRIRALHEKVSILTQIFHFFHLFFILYFSLLVLEDIHPPWQTKAPLKKNKDDMATMTTATMTKIMFK